VSTHPHVDTNEQYGSTTTTSLKWPWTLGAGSLINQIELTTTIQTLYFADKYIKKRKTVVKMKAKDRPQKPEIEGIKKP
jgi:hypothetical protein